MEVIKRNYNEAIEEVFYWKERINNKEVSEYWGTKKMKQAQNNAQIWDIKRNDYIDKHGC